MAMWFDAHAELARLGLQARSNTWPPATVATTATKHTRVAVVAEVATPPPSRLVIDLLEERAAIREYDGGQTRTEAEAAALEDVAQTTGIAPAQLSLLWKTGVRV
jgi:membrane-bound lytic murein transglycosylase B